MVQENNVSTESNYAVMVVHELQSVQFLQLLLLPRELNGPQFQVHEENVMTFDDWGRGGVKEGEKATQFYYLVRI